MHILKNKKLLTRAFPTPLNPPCKGVGVLEIGGRGDDTELAQRDG